MKTRQDDHQWSDFVFWTINVLIFAEERQITASNTSEMPVVFVLDLYTPARDILQ